MFSQEEKKFLYIAQSQQEYAKCKIGITDDLERRLQEYNSTTGKSLDNTTEYLFTCEVEDARQVENDIKKEFAKLRETGINNKKTEIYFYNQELFNDYVEFIKNHKFFKREITIKQVKRKEEVKIVKKENQTLDKRERTRQNILNQAKKAKNDEFYTRYEDVEKEISMYPKLIWKNKCVLCNCDDAVADKEKRNENNTSAFALYFLNNFEELGLKKLICIHYGGGIDLFNAGAKAYVFTKDGVEELFKNDKGFTGSFDDPLSIKILKEEADIVCTNPPFSRARDYWDLIIKSGKKFLLISNITNAIHTYYIKLFAQKKLWAGYNRVDWYYNPKKQLVDASGHWYTNIPIKDRPKWKNLKFVKIDEISEKDKKFDDNGILHVNNNYIPTNYKHPFAVSARAILAGVLEKGYKIYDVNEYIASKNDFSKVLIQKEKE